MNFANDIDLFAEYANIVMENKFYSKPTNEYFTSYVARYDKIAYKHSVDEIQHKYGIHVKMAAKVLFAFSDIMGNFAFVLETRTLEEAKPIIRYIMELKQ